MMRFIYIEQYIYTIKGGFTLFTGEYRIADINKDSQVIRQLTEFENEIAREVGGEVVLIAYQRDERIKD